MTIAPRVEIYTQLSCDKIYGRHEWNHTQHGMTVSSPYVVLLAGVDPVGPHIHHHSVHLPSRPPLPGVTFNLSTLHLDDDDTRPTFMRAHLQPEVDPRTLPSARCSSDPAVQAGAAKLQTIMTTTMGFLSALTTGWWGGFGERHGRTRVLAISTLGLLLT